jgi:hypothetical protein
MEILLNEEKLEFTIENEKSLGEIVKGIESWIALSDHIITSMRLGDTDLFSEPVDKWQNIPLEKIGSLAFTTKSTGEVYISNMETVLNYLSLLKACAAKKDSKAMNELRGGFPFMLESLAYISRNGQDGELESRIADLSGLFNELEPGLFSGWTSEKAGKADELIDFISSRVSRKMEKSIDPETALKEIIASLKASLKEITEVSILLQTGKDKRAMEIISSFSDNLQGLLPVLVAMERSGKVNLREWTVSGMLFREFYGELNRILKQMIEAFNIRDYVLIGDLMEYEIAPRLNELVLACETRKGAGDH